MKRIIFILTLFFAFINPSMAETIKKELSVPSIDGYHIKAVLEYPKVSGQNKFSTVVLLHSLGYSSAWWDTLPQSLINEGYAVINIDLRGHGESIYNSKLVRTSWKNMTTNAFAKYPTDIANVIEYVKSENPRKIFFEDWAIIGADIGANTALIAADKISYKPKTIILMSPSVETRGLYVPVSLAQLSGVDILSISGSGDIESEKAQEYLKKFAQSTFTTYTSESRSKGMILFKNDSSLCKVIVGWLKEYL